MPLVSWIKLFNVWLIRMGMSFSCVCFNLLKTSFKFAFLHDILVVLLNLFDLPFSILLYMLEFISYSLQKVLTCIELVDPFAILLVIVLSIICAIVVFGIFLVFIIDLHRMWVICNSLMWMCGSKFKYLWRLLSISCRRLIRHSIYLLFLFIDWVWELR